MKIVKRIDMKGVSATLVIDSESGTSGWILHVTKGKEVIRTKASASTVLALMMADRDFAGSTTNFYEVDKK
jgi:hypothetical protein